ncbi:class I SAM-dependent methyltransferase [candidate division WOR-3 bacterium]|nr:class I SAM-dependent methyltransferase [candidate division WOR-3 bacterium]
MAQFNTLINKVITSERWFPETFKKDIDFRYLLTKHYCKDKVVLDAGCGVGYGATILAATARKVFAVDYSKETINYAKTNYKASELSYLVMNVKELGFKPHSFDRVVTIEVFEHFREYNTFLFEVKRVLKTNGTFIMSTPNKVFHTIDQKGLKYYEPYHVNLVNFKTLKKILNNYFSSVKIWGIGKHKNHFYKLLQLLDFLNFRLFLKEKQRKIIKKNPVFINNSDLKYKEEIELKSVNHWNAHTFQGFFAVCEI